MAVLGLYGLALYCLSLALRALDVGDAYAVWAGAGTAVIAAIGMLVLGEPRSASKVLGIGLVITGVVTTRPSVQVFRDGDGHEGFNAVVRIDDHRRPDVTHYLWLDRIASVTPLGSA